MFGSKSVVGLDVGSHTVKAVALQTNKERITLQGYSQARIASQDPAVVIRKVVSDLGIKPKRLVTSVSGRSVIVRQVETPRLGADELKAHIAYEADKYIPFGTDEVIIDCQPLPDRPGAKANTMQVLLVAVRRGFVEDHLALLRSAGISPEIIDVDVFALSNAYEMLGPGENPDQQGATALIDIGASKSNIAIVQGNRLLFTREVYMAGNEVTDAIVRTFNEPAEDVERIKAAPGEALEALLDAAMPAFEDLANEIRLSFDYVEGQFEQQVGTVILTGGTSQLANIADLLGNILSRPVHIFDPLAGMDLVPSKYDLQGLDANSPSLTVALGLAAHLIGAGFKGLGGQQSHGWQPRLNREGGTAAPARQGTGSGSSPVVPSATPTPAPSSIPIGSGAHSRDPSVLNMPQIAPPPAPSFSPLTPPPAQGSAAVNLDELMPEEGQPEAVGDGERQSGLLVVLDDDQEMPPSERHRRQGTDGAKKQPSKVIKLENFDEDQDGNLPDLPKI